MRRKTVEVPQVYFIEKGGRRHCDHAEVSFCSHRFSRVGCTLTVQDQLWQGSSTDQFKELRKRAEIAERWPKNKKQIC